MSVEQYEQVVSLLQQDNAGAMGELEEFIANNQHEYMIIMSSIIDNLSGDQNFNKIVRAAITNGGRILKQSLLKTHEYLLNFFVEFPPETTEAIENSIFIGITHADEVIRNTSSSILAQLAKLLMARDRTTDIFDRLHTLLVSENNEFVKDGAFSSIREIIDLDVLTTRYRKFRPTAAVLFDDCVSFLALEDPGLIIKEKCTLTLLRLIRDLDYIKRKPDIINPIYEVLLTNLGAITEVTEESELFVVTLYNCLRCLTKAAIQDHKLEEDTFSSVFEVIGNNILAMSSSDKIIDAFIRFWRSLARLEYLENKESIDATLAAGEEVTTITAAVAPNLMESLILFICNGDYGDIRNRSDYSAPIHAQQCLISISRHSPVVVAEAVTAAYEEKLTEASQSADNEHPLIVCMCLLQTAMNIKLDDLNEFIAEKVPELIDIARSGVTNPTISALGALKTFAKEKIAILDEEGIWTLFSVADELMQSKDESIVEYAIILCLQIIHQFKPDNNESFLGERAEDIYRIIVRVTQSPLVQQKEILFSRAFGLLQSFFLQLPTSLDDGLSGMFEECVQRLRESAEQPLYVRSAASLPVAALLTRHRGLAKAYAAELYEFWFAQLQENPQLEFLQGIDAINQIQPEIPPEVASQLIQFMLYATDTSEPTGVEPDIQQGAILTLVDVFAKRTDFDKAGAATDVINRLYEILREIENTPNAMMEAISLRVVSAAVPLIPPEQLAETAPAWFEIFRGIASELKVSARKMKMARHERNVMCSIISNLFVCFSAFISVLGQAEQEIIRGDKAARETSIIYHNRSLYFEVARTANDENLTNLNSLWGFARMDREIVSIMGRQVNIQLHTHWMKDLREKCYDSDRQLKMFMREYQVQLDNA